MNRVLVRIETIPSCIRCSYLDSKWWLCKKENRRLTSEEILQIPPWCNLALADDWENIISAQKGG